MYNTTICHTHDTLEKIGPHARGLLDHLQILPEHAPLETPGSFVLWNEIDELLHGPHAEVAQREDEERMLWFLNFRLHGEDRIWWTYFRDFGEISTFIIQLAHAFPCLEYQGLENRLHGLRVCSAFYAPTASRQQRADARKPEVASLRDKRFFPLAPFACDHLTSFLKGLGDFVCCAQCQQNAPLPSADTKPSSQA